MVAFLLSCFKLFSDFDGFLFTTETSSLAFSLTLDPIASALDYSLAVIRKPVRTITIRIKDHKTVQVTAPHLMSKALIARFVHQKSGWIEKHLGRLSAAHAAISVGEGELMIHGITYQIQHSPLLLQEYHIDEDHATIYSKKPLTSDEAKRQRYKGYAKKTLSDRLLYYSDTYGISFRKLYVRSGSSKRGSCSSDHNIGLNWKLIQFPEFVMDYVICHELAHIRHMNHSPSFRKHLDTIYPERKAAKKWLKTYGVGLQ